MAEDSAHQAEESGALGDVERKLDRGSSGGCRLRVKVKDKLDESRLPTPPPDPQCSRLDQDRGVTSRPVGRPEEEEEEEDLAAYLSELGASPFEGHSFDYDTPNSTAASAMGGAGGPFVEEAFEHLDRLCALTEQILELRDRSCKHFRRVRALERAKALRNADRRLENALANDEELLGDLPDEDTGFAESLLDAMLSNCREPSAQKRSERSAVRSPSSRQRSRSLALAEQTLSSASSIAERSDADKRAARNAARNGGPKISKWTRVKAAFKWERACTNDLAEIAEVSVATPTTPTARYLRIPEVIGAGNWSGSALSPCASEVSSPSTPVGRVSSASSSNEEVIEEPRKSVLSYPDRQSPQGNDDRKKDDADRCGRSFDRDAPVNVENAEAAELAGEASRGKPLIRITSDGHATTRGSGKEPGASPKRPTPTLTITIPSNEEEIRNLSSPESMSPLLSSAQDSGGSSPRRPKARQDMPSPREFKRQYSTIEEAVTPAPKIQRQDSKWNKVRRAFLTNAAFSVPPSPVKVIPAQSFASDGTNLVRSEALRDYQALREKFGAEFHRKLVEWERLKGGGSVAVARNSRDGLPLNEERLAPEFRRKLQEWKRAKKGRRSGASIEQQRVSRRRLTDWQLWRSSSKPEARCYKNQNSVSSRGSCASIGSAGSFTSDGRQHLCEDFVKRMETWRKMSEAACRSSERPRPPPPPTSRVASDLIDETEFLALEKLLAMFGQKDRKERRESDAKQLNDCFDGDSRFAAATRGVGCGNEVLIRTSVGSYRFEGISREFTRKLYDWEKYRGISPRSSTFRLLGPGYTPFAQDSDEATLAESPTNATGKSRAFHWSLKRSKSDGSVFEDGLRDESYALRRSASLQSLMSSDKLEDGNRIGALPTSENTQGIKDPAEDTAVEDSEPEAMIVDIEDVIEETASPLERVQPHQTPVYSVAASETTSIAVPLGTVTSSHEPSPVFLVEAEDDDCERWNSRMWHTRSSENSPSPERFLGTENWGEDSERTTSLDDEDKPGWRSNWRGERDKKKEEGADAGWLEETRRYPRSNDNLVKFDRSIGWNRDAWSGSSEIFQRYALNEASGNPAELESPLTSAHEAHAGGSDENDNADCIQSASFGTSPATWSADESMDSPRARERMKNETSKLEEDELANEPSDERRSNTKDGPADEVVIEKSEETSANANSRAHHPAAILSDRRILKQTASNLLKLNLDDSKDAQQDERETPLRREDRSPVDLQSTDVDRHYETLTFSNAHTRDDALDERFLYEPVNCQDNHDVAFRNNHRVRGNLSQFGLPAAPTSILSDSTVRTVPITISGDSESRSLERILITEDTLNRIVVPTTNMDGGARRTEALRENFPARSEEVTSERRRDCSRSSFARTNDDQQVARKDVSTTRSVFVKTKRMIFGPFRRSDDRSSSSRKESDSSVDERPPHANSKSKSRSASPKLCRQDALLRVSLSLPWPLRSASKENDVASESRRSSGGRTEDAVGRSSPHREVLGDERKSADHEDSKDQSTDKEPSKAAEANGPKVLRSDWKDATASTTTLNTACFLPKASERSDQLRTTSDFQNRSVSMQDEEKPYEEVNCDRERHEEKRSEMKQDDTLTTRSRQQDEAQPRSDAVPSDLMHKLRILSDAAARREGRVAITEASTATGSSESRSSRIQRAKESFLSRRGGPFCRSMMDPTESTEDETRDPWRRVSRITAVITATTLKPEAAGWTEDRAEAATASPLRPQDEGAPSSGDKDESPQDNQEADVGLRADLVKSASAGMINVDPDTFGRLVTADRGCESLPRTIAKRRDSSGPLAKIVSKLKLSRLIRARNAEGGSGGMSTISTLCRQSLLIDVQNNNADVRESGGDAAGSDVTENAADSSEDEDDNLASSRTTRE